MKNLFLFGILGLLTLTTLGHAQVPDAFSYQAVVRSNEKELLKNQTISVKVSIIGNDVVIFTQTQTATTNENGLLSLTIGGTEDFGLIDWNNGPLFINTQIDTEGGDNYTIETETQLLSVPYSMAAKTAETALAVPELDYLIEKINNLESQIEEIYLFWGVPQEIAFTEYFLDIEGCDWINMGLDECEDPTNCYKLEIINSVEELELFLECNEGFEFPPIDFTRYTLLLAHGVELYLCEPQYDIGLQKLAKQSYAMSVNLYPNAATVITPWQAPILVDKLNEDDTVELIVTRNIDVPQYYIVGFDLCQSILTGSVIEPKGYILISEDLSETFVAFNIPENFYIFPTILFQGTYLPCHFGFYAYPQTEEFIFIGDSSPPEEYNLEYKVKMTYRPMTNEEEQERKCQIHWDCTLPAYFGTPNYIVITSITKIQ